MFVASSGVGLVPKVICGGSGILAGASSVYALYMLREHHALGKYAARPVSESWPVEIPKYRELFLGKLLPGV